MLCCQYSNQFILLLLHHYIAVVQVQIQLDRQSYLAERATKEEAELRAEDERIPTGGTRPMLSSLEGEEVVVSVKVLEFVL